MTLLFSSVPEECMKHPGSKKSSRKEPVFYSEVPFSVFSFNHFFIYLYSFRMLEEQFAVKPFILKRARSVYD